MAYELIETVEVGAGGAVEINFENIPQTFTDLLIVCSTRATDSLVATNLNIQFNDESGVYSGIELLGNGSSVSSGTNLRGRQSAANATSNTFGSNKIYISNYTESANHSISWDGVSENNGTEASQTIVAGLYTGTNAITKIDLLDNFVEHSSCSLYGIS